MLPQIYSELNFVCEIQGSFFLLRGGNDAPIRGWTRSGKAFLIVFILRRMRAREIFERVQYRFPLGNIDHALDEIHFLVETISRNSICCMRARIELRKSRMISTTLLTRKFGTQTAYQ